MKVSAEVRSYMRALQLKSAAAVKGTQAAHFRAKRAALASWEKRRQAKEKLTK